MSKELIEAVKSYENYIMANGIDEQAVNAYCDAVDVAYAEDDYEYAKQVSASAKKYLEQFANEQTGGTLWDLEKYALDNDQKFDLLERYYSVLLHEAQNLCVDSFFQFVEKKRPPKERFYMPRRKQFLKIGLTDALQGMIDDRYDILCISLPPGTGKAQPLYSQVLTPNGFVKMGDLHIGSKIISAQNNVSEVTGIYPQGKIPVYEIALKDGSKCRCSDEHLWLVRFNGDDREIIETKELIAHKDKFKVPKFMGHSKFYLWQDITDIKYIGEEECQCIMIDDPCHLYITNDYIITHNTTIEKFFHAAVIGWYPDCYNLFYSHSGDITRMYYDGVYDIVTNEDTYAWGEVFPNLYVTSTNAKLEQFNVGAYKPFQSLQCTSVGSKNAGKVRANKYLLVDDMIGGIEEALNPNYLDKLWDKYAVDARQRKIPDKNGVPCKEIHIATRWSVRDVIGRIQTAYEGDDRVKTIAVPDIDPKTGKSNFNFEYGGYTEKDFEDIQKLMDDVSYRCLYKQDPIEREGLLFPDDKLRRYLNLPHGEPEIITAQCDTKGKGTDYFVMPILQKYGDDYYCVDCVCDNSADYEWQYENAANTLVRNDVQECEFERNAGGDRVAMEVNKRVEEKGWVCNITDRATETNKEARIFQHSNWILQHIVFKDASLYSPKDPYGVMMTLLKQYSISGKKQLDDVPDVFSNFAVRVVKTQRVATVQAAFNPFRGY